MKLKGEKTGTEKWTSLWGSVGDSCILWDISWDTQNTENQGTVRVGPTFCKIEYLFSGQVVKLLTCLGRLSWASVSGQVALEVDNSG